MCFWHHGGSAEALTAQTGTVEHVIMHSALLRWESHECCDELCCHICQIVMRWRWLHLVPPNDVGGHIFCIQDGICFGFFWNNWKLKSVLVHFYHVCMTIITILFLKLRVCLILVGILIPIWTWGGFHTYRSLDLVFKSFQALSLQPSNHHSISRYSKEVLSSKVR